MGSGGKVVKVVVAISYGKGAIVCHQYHKLDRAYFAEFVQDILRTCSEQQTKMGHDCFYRTTVLFKIVCQHATHYVLKKQSS